MTVWMKSRTMAISVVSIPRNERENRDAGGLGWTMNPQSPPLVMHFLLKVPPLGKVLYTFPYSATNWGPNTQIHQAMGGHFSSKLSQGHPLSTLPRNAPILLAFSTVFEGVLKHFLHEEAYGLQVH